MMTKVDETLRLLAECRCEEIGRTPVLHYGRVQRRLVRLVLGEESPAVRQRGIHVLQAREYAIEAFAKRDLPGIVRSVREPDRNGVRSQLFPNLDREAIVLHRLTAHGRIRVTEGAELV